MRAQGGSNAVCPVDRSRIDYEYFRRQTVYRTEASLNMQGLVMCKNYYREIPLHQFTNS